MSRAGRGHVHAPRRSPGDPVAPPSCGRPLRLRFRCITEHDIDAMCQLLGDPKVMEHYPHPKSRDQVRRWID
ncbi:GNAT family N-acetyltransferase [Mariniluteicoccus endophyticus]